MAIGNYSESEHNYDSAVKIYNTQSRYSDLEFIYNELTKLYILQGKTDKALETFAKYDSLSKSIFSTENSNSISSMRTQFETDKKENENKLLQKENSQQRTLSYFIIGAFLLAVAFAFFIFRGLKKQRSANTIIAKQKEEVHAQKSLIEAHQKETIDSINYAKRIQFALLAQDSLLKENLPEHFVLFKPKDIVSGDFYWATKHEGKFYLAVCDSTGHGVPGAFMSLLNMGFLSEAIKEKNIIRPNEIFNYVRQRLIDSIGNDGQKDGMDAILVCIETISSNEIRISYAAANNQPVLVRDGVLTELAKDKMPVGKGERTESFTLHELSMHKNDILYLYTDGYADQFGGPKGKKFKYRQLNDMLLSVSGNNMEQQKMTLEKEFFNWKGVLEQVDDVCIMAIRV